MKEYAEEAGEPVDLSKIRYSVMGSKEYAEGRQVMVRACHDIFIKINGGILLVERRGYPAKGELWSIGGGIEKGTLIKDSLRKKVEEECGLEIKNLKFLRSVRMFWRTDPNKHGKGIDDISFVYFGEGKGKLKLNRIHKNPIIITQENYEKFKNNLHPIIRDFLDELLPSLNS